MRKIFMFIAALVLVAGMSIKLPIPINGQDVKLYVEGNFETIAGTECIANGEDTIVLCSGERAKQLFESYTVLSVVYKTRENIAKVLAKYSLRILLTEEVDGISNIYGYTPNYKFRQISVDGKNINMQIAKRQNDIVIGFPIIYTDY